ncbi:uncharacterized protein LOC135485163 [Lineus longissimus]|uniref:uncharacterized protein LOC135485163 n=1 Tax=Lineus longissimus TaxID=88925 RepID=UPI00315C505F
MSYIYFSACLVTLALIGGARADPAYRDILDGIYQYRNLRNDGYFDTIPAFEELEKDNEPTDAIPDDMSYYPQYGWEGDQPEEEDNDLASIGLADPYGYEEDEEAQAQEDDQQGPFQLRSTNDLRDPELLENSALWGTHYVSGGAGEGKQHLKPNGEQKNKQEVKSDAALPAYCEPPNPCPKGYSEDKNCQKDVKDTAEFNRQLIKEKQSKGECACDSEHMKKCPHNRPNINTKSDSGDLAALLKNNDFGGSKRNKLVAKKAPHMIRKRYIADEKRARYGYYWKGQKLPTVAKKSPQNIEYDKWWHLKDAKDSEMQMK